MEREIYMQMETKISASLVNEISHMHIWSVTSLTFYAVAHPNENLLNISRDSRPKVKVEKNNNLTKLKKKTKGT